LNSYLDSRTANQSFAGAYAVEIGKSVRCGQRDASCNGNGYTMAKVGIV